MIFLLSNLMLPPTPEFIRTTPDTIATKSAFEALRLADSDQNGQLSQQELSTRIETLETARNGKKQKGKAQTELDALNFMMTHYPAMADSGSGALSRSSLENAAKNNKNARKIALDEVQPSINRITQSAGKDEDASITRLNNGGYLLTWFKEQNGQGDLYAKYSTDGLAWGEAFPLKNGPENDLFPSVIQGKDGTFHMTWFRIEAGTNEFRVHYASSKNLKDWTNETTFTGPGGFGWTPTLLEGKDGTILASWMSGETGNRDVFVASSKDQGKTWENPVKVSNSTMADDFPFLYQKPDGQYVLAWTRYDERKGEYFKNTTSEIMAASSADGRNWSEAVQLTKNKDVDILPSLYHDAATGTDVLTWTSGNLGGSVMQSRLFDNVLSQPTPLLKGGVWSVKSVGMDDGKRLFTGVTRFDGDEEIVSFVR